MNKKLVLSRLSRLPTPVTAALAKINIPARMVFGATYETIKKEFFNDPDIDKQLGWLNRVMKDTPFYANNYCTELTKLSDIKKLPTIDKETVIRHQKDFVSNRAENYDVCTTGGTSGKPLALLLPTSRHANELGALHAIWGRLGYANSLRAVVRNERLTGRDYIINPITKEFIFDGFNSDPAYLDFIYRVMKANRISFYHGYTSNAERFAAHLLSRGYDYSFLKAMITSSENFYPHQQKTFEKLKPVKHMNFYGHTEKLLLGAWCEEGGCYHFYQSYGYAELLDQDGNDIMDCGSVGELVGTTNYNACMPLVRYRTGDYAAKAPERCNCCGFEGLSVSKILGRWGGEKIYNRDKSFVSTTSLNLHNHLYEKIEGLQYYQPDYGQLEVRVIPSQSFNEQAHDQLLACIREKFAASTTVSIKPVKQLERLHNGKYLLLVSRIGATTEAEQHAPSL